MFPHHGCSQKQLTAPIIAYNHTLTTADGLSENNVSSVIKDRDGFMWMATGDGLNRFDGYTFIHFTHSDDDSTSISNSATGSMLVDSKGRLWIGTLNGLNLYDSQTETFRRFLMDAPNASKTNHNTVLDLIEDSNHQLWVGTHGEVYKIDLETLKVVRHEYENEINTLGAISSLFEDRRGRMWVATDNGICIIGPNGIESIIHPSEAPGSLPADVIIEMIQDHTGAIYFGTNGNGLLRLDDENDETFERFTSSPDTPFFRSDIIGALDKDNDGKLLIGTDGEGIYKQDDKGKFRQILGSQSRHLHKGNIVDVFVDEQNTYWLSLYGGGVQVVYAGSKRFQHYRYFDFEMERIGKNSILAIAEDQHQKIWIGTDGAGLYKFDPETESFTSYRHSSSNKNSLSSDVVKSLLVDKKNNVYAGTFGGGLNYFDSKTDNFTRYTHVTGNSASISTNHVWSLLQDSSGKVYVGQLAALDEFFPDQKKFNRLPVAGLNSPSVYCLEEDRKGNIWIGTRLDGLYRYDPRTKTFKSFLNIPADSASIPTNEIVDIAINAQGKLWIGTGNKGMILFDPEKFNFMQIAAGFNERLITNVLEDDAHNVWFASVDGLHKFDHLTSRIYDYTVADGLQGTQFNEGTRLKSSDGSFYIGGTNGLNVFHPETITDDTTSSRVVFTKFTLFSIPVEVNDKTGLLTKSISQTASITLQADQNVFSLEFASLDFNFPKKNQYRYYLEEFDKGWNDANTSRTATYTNLPAGEYTLKVSTPNRGGLWNENAATLKIIVTPRWYERLGAKVAALAFVIALTVLIIHYRTKILFIQKIKLEELVNTRTKELQFANQELLSMEKLKENMLAVMSHEIRTPLNSVIGLTHVLKRRNPRADQVEIIDTLKTSSDHLLHLVNDILDYNKIKAGKLDLEVLRFNLIDTLKQLHAMFVRLAAEKNIRFHVQISTLPPIVKGDPTRLLQVLSNLVSNGIKFTTHGSVTLYARTMEESQHRCKIEFKVEDTGIGIPADKLHLLYEPFSQLRPETHRQYGGSGLGLLIVKNLVEAMKGIVVFDSTPGKSTTVTVTIPFTIEHEWENQDQSFDPSKSRALKGLRVLYTEDVVSNQFLIKTLLADYEIDCDIANDGKETISKISEQEYDVILVDVQLPDISGYELTTRIRHDAQSKNSITPIILFSAHTGIQEEAIRNCGANDFIGKPFKSDDLLLKIERSVNVSRGKSRGI